MIEWKDEYSTGFGDIDAQHRVLFKYINEIEQIVKGQGNSSQAHVANILAFLGTYCKTHFAHEEKCMAEKKCPVAGQNQLAHANFLKAYEGFKERFDQEGVSQPLLQQMHKTCQEWLIQHICKIDTHLKDCAKK